MKTLPADVSAYKKTPQFNQDTLPQGLLNNHSTKAGVWAKIVIIKGHLEYTIDSTEPEVLQLNPQSPGVVEPEQIHRIRALTDVEFYVEFYR